MKKLNRICVAAVFALAAVVACEDDDPVKPPVKVPYENLTQRSHVLNNLEESYNRRNAAKYDELLDADFTFFLAPGDVGGGLPEQWGRTDEITIHSRLFDPNHDGPGPQCTNIDLDLKYEDNLVWAEVPMGDENWYRTTIFVDYLFEVVPDTYFLNIGGAKVELVVRNSGTDEASQWRLVEMRDLTGETAAALGASSAVEQRTWGGIKALYR